VLPGEYYVTRHAEAVSTVLGSCVSACIRDTRLNVGGMNHFMLPLDASNGGSAWGAAVSSATRYGNVAMERLINEILKLGGRRDTLEIKLVGGGRVLAEMTTDIGARNIEFVRQFVAQEGFKVLNEDLGDTFARRVVYFPQTGRMRVRKLLQGRDDTLVAREREYLQKLDTAPIEGEIELF
jgi:chemotaxis protein CheD